MITYDLRKDSVFSAFFSIGIEQGDLLNKSLHSVQIREKTDSVFEHFSHSVSDEEIKHWKQIIGGLSILLTFIFQDFLATAPLNFYASVWHQTQYEQQQSISGTYLMALSICSSQRDEIHQE